LESDKQVEAGGWQRRQEGQPLWRTLRALRRLAQVVAYSIRSGAVADWLLAPHAAVDVLVTGSGVTGN
jgi:hypothetical protein